MLTDHSVETNALNYSLKTDQHAKISLAPFSKPLFKDNFTKHSFRQYILIFENKESVIVYSKICGMTKLIGTVSLQKHTLLGFTMRNNNWEDPLLLYYQRLEHLNVFVTSEIIL